MSETDVLIEKVWPEGERRRLCSKVCYIFWVLVVAVALLVLYGVYETFPDETFPDSNQCIQDLSLSAYTGLVGGIVFIVFAIVMAVIFSGYVCSPFVYEKRRGLIENSLWFSSPHAVYFLLAITVIVFVAVDIPFCRDVDEFTTPEDGECLSFCNHYRTAAIVAVVLTSASLFINSIAVRCAVGTRDELYDAQERLKKL